MTGEPGFFGKVPGRGDFLARRVPAGLHAAWEEWLANLVVAARAALGDSWPYDWLTAPLWHFCLGSALVPPDGAVGVLVASADRVGRLFPFTLIAPAARSDDPAALARWERAAEDLVLGALEDDFDPDRFDAALRGLGPPALPGAAARRSGHWRLTLDGDWPVAADMLDDRAPAPPGPDQSTWWCRGSDRVPPMHLRCAGLPGPETSAAMVSGAFDFPD